MTFENERGELEEFQLPGCRNSSSGMAKERAAKGAAMEVTLSKLAFPEELDWLRKHRLQKENRGRVEVEVIWNGIRLGKVFVVVVLAEGQWRFGMEDVSGNMRWIGIVPSMLRVLPGVVQWWVN